MEKAKAACEMYRADCEVTSINTLYVAADLEKVIMLPRIDQFKKVLFCQRIVVFNETFAPIDRHQNINPFACLWYECISGRKKEDIISAFHAFFLHHRDELNFVIWLDNCAGQNKNWTLMSYIVKIINSSHIAAQSITLRYLEPGHTCMAADSFHHQVELSLKRQNKVYDFSDFVKCVAASNSNKTDVKEMKQSDFFVWQDASSLYKISRATPRPYLKNIVEIVVTRGNYNLVYKTEFSGVPISLNFLKMKALKNVTEMPESIPQLRGITNERKNKIIENLLSLMPENRHLFWKSLPVNQNAIDLRSNFDDV